MSAWTLAYDGFLPSEEGLREALCTLGNGYFATRGAAAEASADGVHYPGTYIAGCYNRLSAEVSARTVENESLVNAPNWLPLQFRIESGPWVRVETVAVLEHRQDLDLRRGVLTRCFRFRDGAGRETHVTQRRLVHMAEPHIAALETVFLAANWSGRLVVRSGLDGRVENAGVERYRGLGGRHLVPQGTAVDRDTVSLLVETSQSGVRIAEAARTHVRRAASRVDVSRRAVEEPGYIAQEFSLELARGEPMTVEKVIALFTSRDAAITEPGDAARGAVARAADFSALLETHSQRWDQLWRQCETDVETDERTGLILHLHTFHILQTVSPNAIDLDAGVPARGLHGEAYRGHIFWDELFILPFLTLRIPEITRALLLYRYRRLPEASAAARRAGHAGAMFPWQSGSNGREETQTLRLNPRSQRWLPDRSHRQRHVGLAIAYNVWAYYQATGDLDFLTAFGAELILAIARFWASIATHNPALDRYDIHDIMGPDEFHDGYPDTDEPGLTNNAYSNVMAAWVLRRALDTLELLPPGRRSELEARLRLTREERERWDDISRKLQVPFHSDGVISQFDGYERLEEFDWDSYAQRYSDIHRLDRILEAEGDTPNRYKLSKQADVLMLFYLLPEPELREQFDRLGYSLSPKAVQRTIEYYSRRTSHGSTLSRIVHAGVLARSDPEESWRFFCEALESDVSDVQGGTTQEGIHLGAMVGTLDLIQRCYAGLSVRDGVLWLDPRPPRRCRPSRSAYGSTGSGWTWSLPTAGSP